MKKNVFLCVLLSSFVLSIPSAFGEVNATEVSITVEGNRGIVKVTATAGWMYEVDEEGHLS